MTALAQWYTIHEGQREDLTNRYRTTGALPTDWSEFGPAIDLPADLELVVGLADAAARLHNDKGEMDRWLAPRLHSAMRLSRRFACDQGIWCFVALNCSQFIEKRFRAKRPFRNWRYNGDLLRNGLSRLWWGAEMTRSGPDYRCVEKCFSTVRRAQFALELRYSWNRPAAIAFSELAVDRNLSDKAVSSLSTTLRVLLSLRALELESAAENAGPEYDESWTDHRPSLDYLVKHFDIANDGPSTGAVTREVLDQLKGWFGSVVDDLQLRGLLEPEGGTAVEEEEE
jgi:hypothetical protein